MLKSMSVALLAASILAAPAFAAGPAKTDTSAKSSQTTGTAKTDVSKTDAAKTDATKPGATQAGDKANEMKPTVGKTKTKPHASLVRHKHRHVAHLSHHNKVSFKRVTSATRRG
ncbi:MULTISPECIES: hypothetical protein [unclassified Bradyrhizobium]|uniref:hypothetical protein n=1 Tax=unclassified Bradyrhizobium TaxID=2631580 RepID=UPI0028E312DD|nr:MULTISPECIES: hypothetical protein [unclassified Bradyrhizobium]